MGALRVGMDAEDADMKAGDMRKLTDAIEEDSMSQDRLRADHFIPPSLRGSRRRTASSFAFFDDDRRVKLASLMDHAPGQRQFVNLETYGTYYQRKLERPRLPALLRESAWAIQTHSARRTAPRSPQSTGARGIVLASHDDATAEHVEEAVEQGVRVASSRPPEAAARASQKRELGAC